MVEADMRVTLLHNPEAGPRSSGRVEIETALRRAGYEVSYQSTKTGSLTAVIETPADLLVIAGGDGTVEKVARRMVGRPIPVALLPIGTSNNIALSLGIEGTMDEQIESWDLSRTVPFDVGRVRAPWGERYFLESVGFGLFAEYIERADSDLAEETGSEWSIGYPLIGQILQDDVARSYQISVDGWTQSGRFVMLEIMNTPFIGPKISFGQKSSPGDGVLELVLAGEARGSDLLSYIVDPSACPISPVSVHQGRHFEIRYSDAVFHVDDEIWPKKDVASPVAEPVSRTQTRIEVDLVRNGLSFLSGT